MLKFLSLINLLFMYNYLFLNDEFAIMVSLLIVFSFLLITLKKYVINMFFHIFDNVYFYFFILLNINLYLYITILKKYTYIYYSLNYNQINLFLIFNNLIFIKKIKDNIILKQIKKIKIIYGYIYITFNLLKYLNNILIKNKEKKLYKIYQIVNKYIYLYNNNKVIQNKYIC